MTATATRSARNHEPVLLDRDREPAAGATGEILQIPLELIDVDANVRASVVGIEDLAASIAEHGVRQPISVRDTDGDRFAINFGQRRYLASKLAGRETIPAFVDNEARTAEQLAIHQLVENLGREDLPALDRARAIRTVVDSGITQADLGRQIGLAPSTVANDLRLLEASPAVLAALEAGQITASHAKTLLPLPVKEQGSFVGRIRSSNLSTHQLEQEVGWKLQTIRGEEASAARSVKQAPRLVEALEAAGVSKDTRVQLQQPYNMRGPVLEAAVKKAGWKLNERGYAWERGGGAKCDCPVVRVDFNRSWKVIPACIDDKHRDRQTNIDHVAAEKRRKAVQANVQRLKLAVAAVIKQSEIPLELVRLMAATRHGDLAQAWGSEDLELVIGLAARNLASAADSEYVYSDDARAIADANLEEAVAAFEKLAGIDAPAEKAEGAAA